MKTMKKMFFFQIFCLMFMFVSVLPTDITAQSEKEKKAGDSQTQATPPNRPPEQVEVFRRLIERATMNGTAQGIVVTRNFADREELLRQLAPFQVRIIALFELNPHVGLEANAAAWIYMRDSDLVTGAQENGLAYPTLPPNRTREELAYFQRLTAQATANGETRVIVGLSVSFTPEGYLTPAQRNAQRAAIRLAQDTLLAQLALYQVRLITRYEFVPYIAVYANAAALEFMRNSSLVKNVRADGLVRPTLSESVPLIGAPNAWSRNFSGAGRVVAVLDTGVDKYHIFLRNKVVSEACYSTNDPTQELSSLCPGGVTQSTEPNSGLHCDLSVIGCDHGTHVAGIAAGNFPEQNRYGVARDAQLISIQIFSRYIPFNVAAATFIDINRGLERVQALSSTYNTAAVNLSLGDRVNHTSYCDDEFPATRDLINNLRSYGIATVIASGNDNFTNGINYPACISSAVSVGSTRDGSNGTIVDTVSTDFSNSASFLSLLAPGEWIFSSVPGGGFANFQGTSMAAPHVAGAWAILKQRVPHASVDRSLRILQATGIPILDPRNGITKPRIQVDTALLRLVAPIFDYDNDDKSDVSVFRPSEGVWYIRNPSGGFTATQFGLSTDRIAPADYDGDGKTDIAVFRPESGTWYVLRSSDGGFTGGQWGLGTDIIAPADYDGDERADFAVFRPENGTWYILQSSNGSPRYVQFGANGDVPVAGDYDGDERADVAVFRPLTGTWYVLPSRSGVTTTTPFGASGDKPVPADYDGDGKTDIAVWRPSTAVWHILSSQPPGGTTVVQFGVSTDLPVPADYDGDRKVDIAVFRPAGGNWYLRRWAIAPNFETIQFGQNGDKPTPNAYIP